MGDEKGDQSMFHRVLKSLCCSYRWSYGVFWRFNPQNSLLLTMEEGYCEAQMGTIVDNMLLRVHMIGYGLVGQVAFTKRHRWMFSDDHYGQRDRVASVEHLFSLEDDYDVHAQFSSGIKTIALIYVESLGVIQFGSTLKIPETSEFVDHTTRLFQETKELETFFLAEITPSASEIDGRSYGIYSFPGNGDSALGSLENYSPNLPLLSPFTSDNGTEASSHLVNHQLQMAMEGASFKSSNESLPEPFLNPTINVNDSTASSPCIISTCVSSIESSMSSTIANTLLAPFPETSPTTPQLETYPLEVSSLSSILSHPSDSVQSSLLDEFQFDDSDKCLNEICAETDLFDDLGIDFDFGEDGSFLDDILSPVVGGDHLGFSSEYTSEQHNWMNNLGLDHLLDGITGNSLSIRSSSFEDELHLAKRGKINSSCSVIRESFEPARVLERKKVMDSLVGPSHNISCKSSDVPVCKSSQKSFKSASSRKKGKKGTRPKSPDRVVIDACISELRKLIPNGSKMSIVSLLAQTAKHAVFLQSMTKHAEKVKRAAGGGDKEYEVVNATSVWEERMLDPVQVRDLSWLPGHKLIQVMMEESGGCCLEMVDVVQGLGLTILKGVMEVKEKKIWAYFLVQAERNMVVVSNQQIYMSLRQLLVHHKAAATAACEEQHVIASDNFLVGGGARPLLLYNNKNNNNFQQLWRRRNHYF